MLLVRLHVQSAICILTLFVRVEAKVCVELLVALFFHDSLAEYGVLVDDIHWLFFLLLLRRHSLSGLQCFVRDVKFRFHGNRDAIRIIRAS